MVRELRVARSTQMKSTGKDPTATSTHHATTPPSQEPHPDPDLPRGPYTTAAQDIAWRGVLSCTTELIRSRWLGIAPLWDDRAFDGLLWDFANGVLFVSSYLA